MIRSFLKGLPIRYKLILIITATSTVALIASVFTFAYYDRVSFERQMVHEMETQANILAMNSSAAIEFGSPNDAHDILSALQSNSEIEAAALYRSDRKLFAVYTKNESAMKIVPNGIESSGASVNGGRVEVWRPVTLKGENLGEICLLGNMDSLEQRQRSYFEIVLFISALSLAVVFLTATWLQRIISRPLARLLSTMADITREKNYRLRVEGAGRDELGQLVQTFNSMLEEIESRDSDLENRVRERTQQLEEEIQERKSAEHKLAEALIQAQGMAGAAQAASAAKSQFLANMSHEIRTPLNGIIGMTSLLLDTPLSQDQSEFTATIQHSADSLLEIISNILDFSKAEAGKLTLEACDFGVRGLIEEIGELFGPLAEAKGVRMDCYADPELPNLRADRSKLRQVLSNLTGNALKFTEQGSIRVEAHLAAMDEQTARVIFSVADTGGGIPGEKLEEIFESFTQADGSTTRKHGGTGLGLTICRQIVELMGGRIWVESKPLSGIRVLGRAVTRHRGETNIGSGLKRAKNRMYRI